MSVRFFEICPGFRNAINLSKERGFIKVRAMGEAFQFYLLPAAIPDTGLLAPPGFVKQAIHLFISGGRRAFCTHPVYFRFQAPWCAVTSSRRATSARRPEGKPAFVPTIDRLRRNPQWRLARAQIRSGIERRFSYAGWRRMGIRLRGAP
jgi:hypothetical protein